MPYETYRAIAAGTVIVIILALILIAPSIWTWFRRKKEYLRGEFTKLDEFDSKGEREPAPMSELRLPTVSDFFAY